MWQPKVDADDYLGAHFLRQTFLRRIFFTPNFVYAKIKHFTPKTIFSPKFFDAKKFIFTQKMHFILYDK